MTLWDHKKSSLTFCNYGILAELVDIIGIKKPIQVLWREIP